MENLNQAPSEIPGSDEKNLRALVEKNLAVSEEILKTAKYIKGYIVWAQIFGVVKVIVILVPLILGLIYLPPLIRGVMDQYKDLLGWTEDPLKEIMKPSELISPEQIDLDKLPAQYRTLLK